MRVVGLIEAMETGREPARYSADALMARYWRLLARIGSNYRFDLPLPDLGTCHILSGFDEGGEEIAVFSSEGGADIPLLSVFANMALDTNMPLFALFCPVARLDQLVKEMNLVEIIGSIKEGEVFAISFDDLEVGKSTDARLVRLLKAPAE